MSRCHSMLIACLALVSLSGHAGAAGPAESGVPIAFGNGDHELRCFQGGRAIVALPKVSELTVVQQPSGRRYSGLWTRSGFSAPEPFSIDASADTTCVVSGADRGFFFSGYGPAR